MRDAMDPEWLAESLLAFGAPLNIHSTGPFCRNMRAFCDAASARGVELTPYFARKANKCLAFVDAARDNGWGVDIASLAEVRQVVEAGLSGPRVVCTAAVKTPDLVDLCIRHAVSIIIDNDDELALVRARADALKRTARIGLRLSGFECRGARLYSRFGFPVSNLPDLLDLVDASDRLSLGGVQFHLNGYAAEHRIAALTAILPYAARLRETTGDHAYIDIGGGFPMSYLAEPEQLGAFLSEHAAALSGQRPPLTFRNDDLGRTQGGAPDAYPVSQSPVQAEWLVGILDAQLDGRSLARHFADNDISLRCEPGRSALDGCGLTATRVVHRKRDTDGRWMIGLMINRTQFRTGFREVLFDPILIPPRDRGAPTPPIRGYFTGTYCTESELMYLREMNFPNGVAVGDMIVFPNTAGYLMHFLESRSHQFDLARNVVFQSAGAPPVPDAIDPPPL